MKLYHSTSSPNSRRVRMFIAEKGISIPLQSVNLAEKEQFSDRFKAINPRQQVPVLVLDDGTTIAEVPAIWRFLEETHPTARCSGATRPTRHSSPCGSAGSNSTGSPRPWKACAMRHRASRAARYRSARLRADSRAGRTQQAPRRRFLCRLRRPPRRRAFRGRSRLLGGRHHRHRDRRFCDRRVEDADPRRRSRPASLVRDSGRASQRRRVDVRLPISGPPPVSNGIAVTARRPTHRHGE